MNTKIRPGIALVALLLVALLTAGAAIGITQAVGRDAEQSGNEEVERAAPFTERDRLEQIGRENPGFGGYYRDRDDTSIVYVYMTDTSQRDVAERAARSVVNDPESIREVRILQGDYEFTDLAEWFRLVTVYLVPAVDEISAKAIDPGTNRIAIGISDLSAQSKVTNVLNELGIPVDAVTIVEERITKLPDSGGGWGACLSRPGGIWLLAAEAKEGNCVTVSRSHPYSP